jgi:hypothetical protein
MVKKKKPINTDRTIKEGLVGGVVGSFCGAPGAGFALGALHANEDKIKKFSNKKWFK